MAVFLWVALCVMMAFSIALGYIVAVRSELQNAADAAALAGAQQLQTYFVQYYMPGQTNQQTIYNNATTDTTTSTAPIPTAQRFAGVTITQATGDGLSNMTIAIQPSGVNDPTAILTNISPGSRDPADLVRHFANDVCLRQIDPLAGMALS
jgi:Flp pilus assembly protein TadG